MWYSEVKKLSIAKDKDMQQYELTDVEKGIIIFSLERLIESDSLFSWNQERTIKILSKIKEMWK